MKTVLPILITLFLGMEPVFATNRYYSDIEERSPNGRYVAEAKSPDNQNDDGPRKPFQDNFTITFTDTQAEKVLWSWKQGEEHFSPEKLIPTDNGQLIVYMGHGYHVFDTKGGIHSVFRVYNSTPKKEWEKFTSETTAGTFWRQYSQQDFITLDGTAYFYIRLYWGRLFVIDIAKAKLETKSKITKQVENHVLEKTKRLIKEFNGQYYEKCKHCSDDHVREDLSNAVFVIKKHNISEGMKLLNEVVEKSWKEASLYSRETGKFERMEKGSNELKRYLDLL